MEGIHFGGGGGLDPGLARSLRANDEDGLPEMLSLARKVGGADFTYWGSVHEGVVDVEWNVGARDSGFGLELPLGEGVGGRVFSRGEAFEVRSVLAVPVRGAGERSGAVLYAVRRTVAPFSDAERTLLMRVKNDIEPVSRAWTTPRLFTSSLDYLKLKKNELRRLLLECDRVRELEAWLENILRGSAILTDGMGHPYVPGNLDRLELLRLDTGDGLRAFTLSDARREGNRLGLPAERGEIWAFAWNPETARERTRLRMLADDVVLDHLGGPLIVLDDGVGVVLLRESAKEPPSAVRDELLKHLGPSPLWLAHGAAYESPEELKEALLQATGAVERLRRGEDGRHISEVAEHGLDSLLESPRTSEELAAFADKMLEPLLDHDRGKGTRLTETFCLALASCSPEEASEKLFVHPNTVRYRMRQAQKILSTDLALPKERTAMSLAAFAWLRRFASPSAPPRIASGE